MNAPIPVILASASRARQNMLKQAGLDIGLAPADIDEGQIKANWSGEPEGLSVHLAEAKAYHVSATHPGALIIGADQILVLLDRIFDKPGSIEGVRSHLMELRGKTHSLLSSVVVVQDQKRLWAHTGRADLDMRNFSDAFLDQYVKVHGEEVINSVGAYHLEGFGAQLFERVEGDYFTVLGLPLISLLNFCAPKARLIFEDPVTP